MPRPLTCDRGMCCVLITQLLAQAIAPAPVAPQPGALPARPPGGGEGWGEEQRPARGRALVLVRRSGALPTRASIATLFAGARKQFEHAIPVADR